MMSVSRGCSAVENRRRQILRQLDHLRSQLAKRGRPYYENEIIRRRQSKRATELIAELEAELLALECPGEYEELPVAVVADELGLSYDQVRRLIKSGEIEATGKTAHERVNRAELERIADLGVPELLRLGRQEDAEIFEQAIPHLKAGDADMVRKTYRRLESRQSWRGPYAPAFLVCLEIISGELEGALASVKLVYDLEDPLRRAAVMTYLVRLLRTMRLEDKRAQEFVTQLILMTEGVPLSREKLGGRRTKQSKAESLDTLRRKALYLAASVMCGLRITIAQDVSLDAGSCWPTQESELHQLILDAIYTALYSELFYEDSAACRMYADLVNGMIQDDNKPAYLKGEFFRESTS